MAMIDWTDAQVATAVRMLMREQLDHEAICVLGRDRIMSLSAERDRLRAERDAANAAVAGLRELIERGAALVDETLAPLWKKNNGFTDAEDELYTWKDSEVTAALSRTPDQHRARIEAAGLREAAVRLRKQDCSDEAVRTYEWLTDEADRLERGE